MAKKSIKKKNNNSSKKSRKIRNKRNWYCFGTMTILSNHKRTAEKYLNQLDAAGVKPEDIEIYQAKGQNVSMYDEDSGSTTTYGGYSRINICYYADKKILDSRF